jgi:hypothetical protein
MVPEVGARLCRRPIGPGPEWSSGTYPIVGKGDEGSRPCPENDRLRPRVMFGPMVHLVSKGPAEDGLGEVGLPPPHCPVHHPGDE